MPRKISAKKRAALIRDLINADLDLTTLRDKYGLTPDSLSQWIQEESNRRCLTGLCALADIQTQLMLSRFRLITAGRLIDMATEPPEDSRSGFDTSRRACVDLLKLELPRADTDTKLNVSDLDSDDGLDALQNLMNDTRTHDHRIEQRQTQKRLGDKDD